MDVLLTVIAAGLVALGAGFVGLGVRLLRGSSNAYEMNRKVSSGLLGTARGHTLSDDIEGFVRVNHGIAFYRDKASRKIRIVPQSSLSNEAILETLRH